MIKWILIQMEQRETQNLYKAQPMDILKAH